MKKDMTQEEEAQEIVRRLKMTKKEILEEDMFKILADEIAKEIDEKVLEAMNRSYIKLEDRSICVIKQKIPKPTE